MSRLTRQPQATRVLDIGEKASDTAVGTSATVDLLSRNVTCPAGEIEIEAKTWSLQASAVTAALVTFGLYIDGNQVDACTFTSATTGFQPVPMLKAVETVAAGVHEIEYRMNNASGSVTFTVKAAANAETKLITKKA